VDTDDKSGTRRCWWLNEDSTFTGPLAGGFGTPPNKFSLAAVRLESSATEIDLAVCSTNGMLFGVVDCLSKGVVDLLAVDTVRAGAAI